MTTINGTPEPDILIGTTAGDLISGLAGNDILNGRNGDDILNGEKDNDILRGGNGNDTLTGGNGNDILIGNRSTTVGEIDTFNGGGGADKFVLGTATEVLYEDNNTSSAGLGDYALITDFNPSVDVIQLKGQSSNYLLKLSPNGLPKGTAIYRIKPGSIPDELIGIIQNQAGLSLNSTSFQFVGIRSFNLSALDGSNGFVLNGVIR